MDEAASTCSKTSLRRSARKFECYSCHKKFSDNASLLEHIPKHNGKGKKKFVCKLCGKDFIEFENFKCHKRLHMELEWSTVAHDSCVTQKARFDFNNNTEPIQSQDQCTKSNSNVESLYERMRPCFIRLSRIKPNIPSYKLQLQLRMPKTSDDHNLVQKTALKPSSININQNDNGKKSIRKPHDTTITQHFKRSILQCTEPSATENKNPSKNKTKTLQSKISDADNVCPEQQLESPTPETLLRSVAQSFCESAIAKPKFETEKYVCKACRPYTSHSAKWNLERHIQVMHGKQQQYECHFCSKTIRWLHNYKAHLKKDHFFKPPKFSKTLTFPCGSEKCTNILLCNPFIMKCPKQPLPKDKKISVISKLKLPPARPNPVPKLTPYTCKTCRKSYVNNQVLQNHIRVIHSREERYKCYFCMKTCTWKHNYELHLRKYHLDRLITPKKLKVCPICPYKDSFIFTSNQALQRHIGVLHEGKERLLCPYCHETITWTHNYQNHLRGSHFDWDPSLKSI